MVNKRMRRRIGLVVTVVAVVALIAVLTITPSTQASSGYTIKACVADDCGSAPFLIGDQIGYFNNRNVDLVKEGALDESLQPAALISGQIDVMDAQPDAIINMLQDGAKVSAVAMSGSALGAVGNITQNYDMNWAVLNGSSYQTIHDIAVKGGQVKVGTNNPGICMELDSAGWYAENNVSMNDFDYVVLSAPQLEQALRQGLIDIAVLPTTFYDTAFGNGGVRSIGTSNDPFGALAMASYVCFTDAFIAAHPDAVRAFVEAYKSSERWSDDHQAQSAELTEKAIGQNSVTTHWYSYTGAINDSDLQLWIDALVSEGTIHAGEYQPSDLYTTEFSDLWVNESSPQPLNPYGLSTNVNSGWVNQSEAASVLQTLTSPSPSLAVKSVGDAQTAGLLLLNNALSGNTPQTILRPLRPR
jgi:ABC-type nitrate/sulfonate/bicarbonate transport system substrate-binding protein